jgi:hypothetical protein
MSSESVATNKARVFRAQTGVLQGGFDLLWRIGGQEDAAAAAKLMAEPLDRGAHDGCR